MKYKGYEIEIMQDEDAESPREWDNLGTMYCKHGRYTLGDEGADPPAKEDGEVISLPLYLYDHGGVTMNTTGFSCRWDSGQVGIIYVTKARLKEEQLQDKTVEEIEKYLKDEVETYDNYLTGNVYGFNIPDIEEENCYGYYGYDHEASGLLEEVRSIIDYEVKREQDAKHAQIKRWILNKVSFIYRVGVFSG